MLGKVKIYRCHSKLETKYNNVELLLFLDRRQDMSLVQELVNRGLHRVLHHLEHYVVDVGRDLAKIRKIYCYKGKSVRNYNKKI
jgi:hypothetical protein